ncbi:uncharacterized protein G2W53_011152 [Senna tora]|uniref:Uncharacterized protein n=1 Tax=Senna tora TaxID=362788 RepID=A0A834X2F3_9FABA|nr:uncharacterized protein G2W53_011152 [Senna tora]
MPSSAHSHQQQQVQETVIYFGLSSGPLKYPQIAHEYIYFTVPLLLSDLLHRAITPQICFTVPLLLSDLLHRAALCFTVLLHHAGLGIVFISVLDLSSAFDRTSHLHNQAFHPLLVHNHQNYRSQICFVHMMRLQSRELPPNQLGTCRPRKEEGLGLGFW